MTRKLGETIPRALLSPWHGQVAKETWPGWGLGAPPFRGYCLLSLPRLSGGSSATLSATIPLHWPLAAAIPALHLPSAAWPAASLPVAVPSCSRAGGMDMDGVISSGVSLGCEGWGLALVIHLHTPASSPCVIAPFSSLSLLSPFPWPAKKKNNNQQPNISICTYFIWISRYPSCLGEEWKS